jgi:hypothetical protein
VRPRFVALGFPGGRKDIPELYTKRESQSEKQQKEIGDIPICSLIVAIMLTT